MDDRKEHVQRLLEQLQEGTSHDESFRQLYRFYYRPLYYFFAKRGFSPEDCLDLTQETFLRIYRGIDSFRREAQFDTWLWTIATNVYRARFKRESASKRIHQEVPLERFENPEGSSELELPANTPLPLDESLLKERSQRLREAIEKLPDQMRKCLILRVYHDLKYREISIAMRLSIDTVKAHLFQARRRLQEDLGEYFIGSLSEPGEGTS